MYKILIIEDDVEVFELIQNFNSKTNQNYELHHLLSGETMYDYLNANVVDLILMDWQLENESGLDLIKELKSKAAFAQIPTILLTAKNSESEQIQGLDGGADDYITKPFSFKILFSKINAFLRKGNQAKNITENVRHKFLFHSNTLEVEYMGKQHKLTSKEYLILQTLVNNPEEYHSQDKLNELTSGKGVHVSKRCIDTFITILRKKIGKDCILSIRKRGYKINDKFVNKTIFDSPIPKSLIT